MAEALDNSTIVKLLQKNAQINTCSDATLVELGMEAMKTLLAYGELSTEQDFLVAAIMFEMSARLTVGVDD